MAVESERDYAVRTGKRITQQGLHNLLSNSPRRMHGSCDSTGMQVDPKLGSAESLRAHTRSRPSADMLMGGHIGTPVTSPGPEASASTKCAANGGISCSAAASQWKCTQDAPPDPHQEKVSTEPSKLINSTNREPYKRARSSPDKHARLGASCEPSDWSEVEDEEVPVPLSTKPAKASRTSAATTSTPSAPEVPEMKHSPSFREERLLAELEDERRQRRALERSLVELQVAVNGCRCQCVCDFEIPCSQHAHEDVGERRQAYRARLKAAAQMGAWAVRPLVLWDDPMRSSMTLIGSLYIVHLLRWSQSLGMSVHTNTLCYLAMVKMGVSFAYKAAHVSGNLESQADRHARELLREARVRFVATSAAASTVRHSHALAMLWGWGADMLSGQDLVTSAKVATVLWLVATLSEYRVSLYTLAYTVILSLFTVPVCCTKINAKMEEHNITLAEFVTAQWLVIPNGYKYVGGAGIASLVYVYASPLLQSMLAFVALASAYHWVQERGGVQAVAQSRLHQSQAPYARAN